MRRGGQHEKGGEGKHEEGGEVQHEDGGEGNMRREGRAT